jgi:ComB4 competence protein
MLNPLQALREMHRQNYVAEWFPITDILPDNKTCVTKHGTLVQVIKLDGKDYTSLSMNERERLYAERKAFFEKIDEDITVSVFACRRRYREEFTNADFENKYAALIADKLKDKFTTSYKTEIYVVVKLPIKGIGTKGGLGSRKFTKEIGALMGRANSLSGHTEVLKASLSSFKPKVLEHNDSGHSELLAFWAFLLNGGSVQNTTSRNTSNLQNILGYSDIEFIPKEPVKLFKSIKDKFKKYSASEGLYSEVVNEISSEISKGNYSYMRFTGMDQTRFGAALFLKYYPQTSEDTLFEDMLSLQREFCLIQHFEPTNKDMVLEQVQLRINQLTQFGRFVGSLLGDLHDFADGLSSDDFQQVKHAMHLIVYGDNSDEVDGSVNAINSALAAKGINVKREEGFTEAVYWSQFPDYEQLSFPRTAPISTETAADFCTFGAKPFGNTKCSWGDEPVAYFKANGSNYAFTFHPTPEPYVAAHTLIVGSTGSGKTLTMDYLMSQCLKYTGNKGEGRFKALIFDALNGMKVPVNAFGGNYIDLNDDGFVPLNPMQLPDSQQNRAFLARWIESLVGSVSDRERNDIARAIRTNYESLELHERSLLALREAFGVDGYDDDDTPFLAQKLAQWMPREGSAPDMFQSFFNADEDALTFKKQLVAFEMSFLKEEPRLLAPLAYYLFHSFEDYIRENPCPHMWFIDEAINFVSNPILYPHIRRALKEWRKVNGVVVAAIQDLETLNTIDVGQEFLQSFQTYILFKDSQASPENYLGGEGRSGVGLNEAEFQWIKSPSNNKREVMVKRKNEASVILDIDLSDLGKTIHLLRSDKEVLNAFKTFKDDPAWQEKLMNAVR